MTSDAAAPAAGEPVSTRGRPPGRPERALTGEQALELIAGTAHCVLASADAAGVPYAVPVTPVFANGALYFHGTAKPSSRRSANLRMNPEVSLCFIGKAKTLPEQYSVDYASAVVAGRALLVTDEAERLRAMRALLARHAPGNDPEKDRQYLESGLQFAQVWKIEIESVTGKARCGSAKWNAGEA